MLVDFVVVPGVFRNIANFFEAGELGIYLFQRLNSLELVVASTVLAILVFIFRSNRRALPLLIAGFLVLAIVLVYFTWLTPKIEALTTLWKINDDVQLDHQYYHRLYVIMDTIKILLLLFMMVSTVRKEEWT